MKSRESKCNKVKTLAIIIGLAVIWVWSGIATAQTIDTLWFEDFEENVWDRYYVTDGSWEAGPPSLLQKRR